MPRHRTGTVFQDDEGRWWARVRYTDEFGRRREKKRLGPNKTNAYDKRDELITELKREGVTAAANDRVTFADLAAYYEKNYLTEAEYRDGRKISGLRNWRKFKSTLKTLKAHFGNKKLRSLTYGDLRNYRLMRLRCKSKRNDKTMLTIAAVNREMSLLRKLLGIAQQQRWLLSDLFKTGNPLITPADEKHRERVMSRDEEERLLAQCIGPRAHLRGLIVCGVDTGMRTGEILLLRWADVDFESKMLTVEGMHTKTLRERQVGITPRLETELRRIYAESKPESDEWSVFGVKNNFKRSWGTACREAKVVGLRFHDLRHTYVTRMINAGMPQDIVSRLVGHTQPKTTYRYTNLTPEAIRRAVELLTATSEVGG